jgi:hypothetical protein
MSAETPSFSGLSGVPDGLLIRRSWFEPQQPHSRPVSPRFLASCPQSGTAATNSLNGKPNVRSSSFNRESRSGPPNPEAVGAKTSGLVGLYASARDVRGGSTLKRTLRFIPWRCARPDFARSLAVGIHFMKTRALPRRGRTNQPGAERRGTNRERRPGGESTSMQALKGRNKLPASPVSPFQATP